MPCEKKNLTYVGHAGWGTAETASGEAQPRRRSRHEIDVLIMDAARSLFAAKGYAGTTVREIAARAGVYEPMIYRRFGSKRELFDAAVIARLDAMATSLPVCDMEGGGSPQTCSERVEVFIKTSYELLVEYRDAWIAILTDQGEGSEFEPTDEPPAARGARWLLDRLMLPRELKAASKSLREDAPPTVLVVLSMVLGAAILEPYFTHISQGRVTCESLTGEMIRVCLHGVLPDNARKSKACQVPGSTGAGSPNNDLVIELLGRLAKAERRAARAEVALELGTREASQDAPAANEATY